MRSTLCALAALALAACAAPPDPKNIRAPSADFAVDRWSCQKEVANMPPLQQAQQPASSGGTRTSCRPDGMGGVDCRTRADGASGVSAYDAAMAAMAQGAAQRAQNERDRAWQNCMEAKGWRW